MPTRVYYEKLSDLEEGKVEIDNPVVGEASLAPVGVDEGPEDEDHRPNQEPTNQLGTLIYEVSIKKERDNKKRDIEISKDGRNKERKRKKRNTERKEKRYNEI